MSKTNKIQTKVTIFIDDFLRGCECFLVRVILIVGIIGIYLSII